MDSATKARCAKLRQTASNAARVVAKRILPAGYARRSDFGSFPLYALAAARRDGATTLESVAK